MLGNIHDVDLKLLRVFYMIVKCGGFTPAQLELGISQANMSAKMSKLEGRIGARLCERGKSGFRLTADGEVVFRATENLHSAIDAFKDEVATTGSELKGELKLGVIDNTITNDNSHIDKAISAFLSCAPSVNLNVFVGDPVELEVQVLDGRLDLAVGLFNKKHAALEYKPLYSTEHALYCGNEHALFAVPDEEISEEDLLGEKYVNRGYLEFLDEFSRPAEFSDSHSISQHIEGLALLVLSGHYVATLPVHYAEHWVNAGKMRQLKPEKTRRKSDVLVVSRNLRNLPVVAMTFLTELETCHLSAL